MTRKQAKNLWLEGLAGNVIPDSEDNCWYEGTKLYHMASMIVDIPFVPSYGTYISGPRQLAQATTFLREWANALEKE